MKILQFLLHINLMAAFETKDVHSALPFLRKKSSLVEFSIRSITKLSLIFFILFFLIQRKIFFFHYFESDSTPLFSP